MSRTRYVTLVELKRNFKSCLQKALDTGEFVPTETGLDNQVRDAIDAVAAAYPRTRPQLVAKARMAFAGQISGAHEYERWKQGYAADQESHRSTQKLKDRVLKMFFYLTPYGGDDGDEKDSPKQDDEPKVESKEDNDKKEPEDDDEFSGYSTKELKRIARDLLSGKKTIEKERDKYKAKIDEDERKSRTDAENLTKDLETERETNRVLRATNAKLVITQAIISDNRYQWHNPEIVAQQLNSEIVKVSDDGTVEGIRKELDRIAKEHSYLLKKTESKNPPTGFQPGTMGGSQSGSGQPDVKELAKLYPALASRLQDTPEQERANG